MKLRLIIALLLCISFADLIAQPNKGWEGEWKARKNYTFKITNVTDKTFDYSFNCFNGTNIGEAEGKANINGNLAISIPPEENTCKIKFILNGDNIEVIDIMENDCYVDAGNGVRYNGKYKKTSNYSKSKNVTNTITGTYSIFKSTLKLKLIEVNENKIQFELIDQFFPDRDYSISGIFEKSNNEYVYINSECSIKIKIQNTDIQLTENNNCNEIGTGMSVSSKFNGIYKLVSKKKPKIT